MTEFQKPHTIQDGAMTEFQKPHTIQDGDFNKLPTLITATHIQELSQNYINAIAKNGCKPTSYDSKAWTISRNVILNECYEINDPVLGPVFRPIVQVLQPQLELLLNSKVELNSACGHLYNADVPNIETGSSWSEHRDYTTDNALAFASVIIQGFTSEGFDGGGLTLRVGETKTFVQLDPGDALVLHKTWHLPHTITRGRRLVFVLFFRQMDAIARTQKMDALELQKLTRLIPKILKKQPIVQERKEHKEEEQEDYVPILNPVSLSLFGNLDEDEDEDEDEGGTLVDK